MVETRFDKIVVRSKLPTPFASAEAFGAGAGRALQRTGAVMANVADKALAEIDRQKQKDAVNRGMQFENSFDKLRREKVNSDYLTRKGQAALGTTAAWEKDAEEWYNQQKELVTNDYDQKVLDEIYRRRNGATLDALTRFEAQEKERYYEENTANRLKSALDDALANYKDDRLVAQAYNSGLAALRVNYADRPDLLSVKEKEYKSDFYKTQTLRRADDDAADAAAYYQQHKTQIAGSEHQAIEKLIEKRKQFQAELPYKMLEKQVKAADMQVKISQYKNQLDFDKQTAGMDDSGKLQYLQDNEAQYSGNWFKAKQKALLSAKGITAETRAETAQEILLDITMLDKNNEVDYLNGAQKVLTKIENEYAEGRLSPTDRKTLTAQVYRKQSKQVDFLKTNEDDDVWWRWNDFTYKDANEYIEENSSSPGNNSKLLLDYFRKVNDGGKYDNKQKRVILSNIVNKQKQADLLAAVNGNSAERMEILSFATIEEAKAAYENGTIKKGDKIYINGVRGTVDDKI